MPRHNQPRQSRKGYVQPNMKPSGKKRPRSYHHGAQRDEHFAEAERLMRQAEERAA